MILKNLLGGEPLGGINLQHLAQQRLDGVRLALRHGHLRPIEERLDRRLLEPELLPAVRVGVEQRPLLVEVPAGALPAPVHVLGERAERGGDAEEVVVVTLGGSRVGAGEEERVAGEELEEEAAPGPDVDVVGIGGLAGEDGLGRAQVGGQVGTTPGRAVLEEGYTTVSNSRV